MPDNYHSFCILVNLKVKNTPEFPSVLLIHQFEGKKYLVITINSVFLFFSMAKFIFFPNKMRLSLKSLISDLRQLVFVFGRKMSL